MTKVSMGGRALAAAFLIVGAPAAAGAQQDPAPVQDAARRLIVERIQSGVVYAPEVRFTEVNDRPATLAGGYIGWLEDQSLLIGAGGYWLANGDDDFGMLYAGPMVGWQVRGAERIGFGARALVGGGRATIGGRLGDLFDFPEGASVNPRDVASFHRGTRHGRGGGGGFTADSLVVVREMFIVAEPQGTVFWRVTRWMRIDGGVGYRLIGAAGDLEDRLSGLSGSVSIRFGAN